VSFGAVKNSGVANAMAVQYSKFLRLETIALDDLIGTLLGYRCACANAARKGLSSVAET
jgi:hypothetical protein